MKLIVASMSVRAVQRALPAPVGGARHRTNQRHALLVDLVGDVGGRACLGCGEAAPLPGLSLETFDEVASALSAFAAVLPLAIELDDALLPALEQRCIALPPSARAAIETALLDLAAQALERPLWQLLRNTPAHALPLAAVVDAEASSLDARLDVLAAEGIRTVKCKAMAATLARIAARFALRVDLNRALSPGEFARIAPTLHALRPELVEEPVDADLASWLIDGAAALPQLPYAVDESLAARDAASSLRAWARFLPAIAAGRVAAVVLKPARDGVFGALALGHRAAQLGVPVIVSHFWDGPRAHLSACHLALALSTERTPAQGLASFAADDDVLRALLRGGVLRVPRAPGLGIR
jgi:L-alanine-DL-glutamate epimerase-like enolase superfamily enzyme